MSHPIAVAFVPAQILGDGLLGWAITFFVLAVVAGVAGFRGIAGVTMRVAKLLVVVFLLLAVVSRLL